MKTTPEVIALAACPFFCSCVEGVAGLATSASIQRALSCALPWGWGAHKNAHCNSENISLGVDGDEALLS